jgi:CRP-like cAMP-binding protein
LKVAYIALPLYCGAMKREIHSGRCENCIVRQINALKAMSKEELKQVSDAKITKKIKKGETIFDEGERLNGVFCVRNGVSKLSQLSDNGNDQIVKIAGKGEVIGKRAVIAEEKIHLKATALSDMEVCFIPKHQIVDPLKNNHRFSLEVLKSLTDELKEADNIIVNRSQKSVSQRLAEVLLYLKDNYGEDEQGFLKLVLTREDLAGIVGTAKESCIRNLSQLKKDGYIETDGNDIAIKDENALLKIIDGKRYRN